MTKAAFENPEEFPAYNSQPVAPAVAGSRRTECVGAELRCLGGSMLRYEWSSSLKEREGGEPHGCIGNSCLHVKRTSDGFRKKGTWKRKGSGSHEKGKGGSVRLWYIGGDGIVTGKENVSVRRGEAVALRRTRREGERTDVMVVPCFVSERIEGSVGVMREGDSTVLSR